VADPLSTLQAHARPLSDGTPDALVERLARHRVVCIGEASHGTHEFYDLRARITDRLVREHGFAAVLIEGDWPDAAQVDRWLRAQTDHPGADAALSGFERFPRWMWRNRVVEDFLTRLHADISAGLDAPRFLGVDLYSLSRSIDEVLRYLGEVDPEAAARARDRYACFDHTGIDGQRYGFGVLRGQETCEQGAIDQLVELSAHADGPGWFDATQNARLVADAEAYYRAMYRGREESWNLRDEHMAATVQRTLDHLQDQGEVPRVVVWAHNSHLGDARATEMSWRGEHNVGQLLRERLPDGTVLVGQMTHTGEVSAADDWGEEVRRIHVRASLPGSVERLLHGVERPSFWLDLHDTAVSGVLDEPRLERAIGVIYRPETERISHYFQARAARQFDVLIHVDETTALEPLEVTSGWRQPEAVPDTYPWAV
jgi:erythromycin esterase-like protein